LTKWAKVEGQECYFKSLGDKIVGL